MADAATSLSVFSHIGTVYATGITTISRDNVILDGDVFICEDPIHNSLDPLVLPVTPITTTVIVSPTSPQVYDIGSNSTKLIAYVGCETGCGAMLMSGNSKLRIGQ